MVTTPQQPLMSEAGQSVKIAAFLLPSPYLQQIKESSIITLDYNQPGTVPSYPQPTGRFIYVYADVLRPNWSYPAPTEPQFPL